MNYLYQITNLLNNKIYIGVHKTSNINDGYMGSGKIVKSEIEKYGIENFKKDILQYFDTYNDALLAEASIVTEEFLARSDVYNLQKGGTGGFDYINRNNLNNSGENGYKGGVATMTRRRLNPEADRKFREYSSIRLKELHSLGTITYNNFEGREHSESSKEKMRIAKKNKGTSTENSQFGTMWVTDGTSNKKIKKHELIPEGWKKGRNMRY